jgi:hypothetical protein
MHAADSERLPAEPDAVRPELKSIGILIFVVLVTAAVLLYVFAADAGRKTDSLLQPGGFAWPVKPAMTAMFMGSCYGAGAYFFYRVSFGRSWHAVAAYFPGIAAFAWLMGISTFLHWDTFNHGHVAFFAWLSLYVTTPLLVPLLYVRNRSADHGSPNVGEAVVPSPLRALVAVGGATLLAIALLMYLAPSAAIDVAPWKLTPLTSRVIAAFLSASGIAAVLLSRDRRWSAWKVFVRSAVLASALLLVAALRAWDEFDTANALAYGFLAATGALIVAGLALDRVMQRRCVPRENPADHPTHAHRATLPRTHARGR